MTMDKERLDFDIPHASVVRILKAALPPGTQLSKESRIAFAKSAGIFVMYLTAVANDFCQETKRQTLSASDVFDALKEIDLEGFVEPLKKCLEAQRAEAQARKKAKVSVKESPSKGSVDEGKESPSKGSVDDDGKTEKTNGNPVKK